MPNPIIQFDNITKVFAGVTALDEVSLSIEAGECHALIGENGAGKSTLGKVLAGIHLPESGELKVEGQPRRFGSPADALAAGVGMVHQELAFCPDLSVAENLCLGQYPKRAGLFVNRRAMREKAQQMLDRIGSNIDVRLPMRRLSTAQEQLVQIAAVVGTGAKIIIFDEPTSSLSGSESEHLFELIGELKSQGVTMIYVSHRLAEVLALSDRISVLRDGSHVGTLTKVDATEDKLVELMTGRVLEQFHPKHTDKPAGAARLKVSNLSSPGLFTDISFEVKAGEVLGMAGLVGSGRSEVAQAAFGLDSHCTGSVVVDNKPIKLHSVRAAMTAGLCLVPEDRKRQGLILSASGRFNYSLAILDSLKRFGLFNHRAERVGATESFERLAVKTPSIESLVAGLSGGNQQKIVLAKWLARNAKVLIVDEPTRGIDVGAKAAVHELLDELALRGLAVLVISSDLPEVLQLCSRILVMREGRLAGEVMREDASEQSVMRMMAGVSGVVAA